MTVLYENRRRAKRARLGILGAVIWSIGWFYWAYVLNSGGTRTAAVVIVILVGLLPFVALHFYGSAYVVRLAREGNEVIVTTLGLFTNHDMRVPVTAILEVARPEAAGMTIRVAGRRMPFMLDMQAEHGDLAAIAALANHSAPEKP
jgi:hypothetical protein